MTTDKEGSTDGSAGSSPLHRGGIRAAGRGRLLGEDDRVELIAGAIVTMSPMEEPHVLVVNRLGRRLYRAVGDDLTVSVRNPIRLGEHDEPRPDLAILRGADRGIADAADVQLVMEVADPSRDYDRNRKLPRYAAAGIPESWLFDLVADIAERHTDPRDGLYHRVAPARRGEALESTVPPNLTINVGDILP